VFDVAVYCANRRAQRERDVVGGGVGKMPRPLIRRRVSGSASTSVVTSGGRLRRGCGYAAACLTLPHGTSSPPYVKPPKGTAQVAGFTSVKRMCFSTVRMGLTPKPARETLSVLLDSGSAASPRTWSHREPSHRGRPIRHAKH
jgi:hypothetical protein